MAWIRACGGGAPAVPNGKTVTPINDVTIWQQCAGIANPTYTTLAEILADVGILSVLMASDNAVDYLVRSKTFIGDGSLVPTMTSNTTPSGEAFGFSAMSGYEYYKAFDGDDTSFWRISAGTTSNAYVGYNFGSAKRVGLAKVIGNNGTPQSVKIQGSNDGTTWADVSSVISIQAGVETLIPIDPSNTYSRFRVYWTNPDSGIAFGIRTIQFYSDGICSNANAMTYIGQNNYASNTLLGDSDWRTAICNSAYFESVLNVKVPTMTSNTTPSGECFANSEETDRPAYKAFDKSTVSSDKWTSTPSNTLERNDYVGYDFGKTVKVCKFTAYWKNDSTNTQSGDYYIESSNDKSTWSSPLYTGTNNVTISDINVDAVLTTVRSARYFRLRMKYANQYLGEATKKTCSVIELQFYGREDV